MDLPNTANRGLSKELKVLFRLLDRELAVRSLCKAISNSRQGYTMNLLMTEAPLSVNLALIPSAS